MFFRRSIPRISFCSFFFFNDTATTEIYTLSLHDALPIYPLYFDASYFAVPEEAGQKAYQLLLKAMEESGYAAIARSEEHTSELQSLAYLVCRLLLEKKKTKSIRN